MRRVSHLFRKSCNNLPQISHIGQNHSTFPLIATKIKLKEVISTGIRLPCPNSFSTTKLKIDSCNHFLGHWGSQKEAVKSKISKFCYKNSCPLAKYLDSNIKIFANVKNIFGLFTTQCFTNSSLLTYSLMENNGGWVCKAIIFLSAKMTKAKLRFFAIQWLPCADMKCFMQCFTNVE